MAVAKSADIAVLGFCDQMEFSEAFCTTCEHKALSLSR
jgi:hypothetical protein